MINTSRTLARYAWVNIGLCMEQDVNEESKNPYRSNKWNEDDQREKRSFLKLAVAFVIATKHHVRNEFGSDYDDLRSLFPADFQKVVGDGFGSKMNGHAYGTINSEIVSSPLEENIPDSVSERSIIWVRNELERPSIPLPLAILHYMQMQLATFRARGFFDGTGPAGYNFSCSLINALNDELGTVERLARQSIPTSYGIHLKQSVTMYLFILPLCLVDQMSWKMIPFVTAFSCVLLGIEGIASAIEQPFGTAPSDLPLDLYCAELKNEIFHVISRFPDTPFKSSLKRD